MIDLRLLRNNPEVVRDTLSRRGVELDLDRIIELDARHRELIVKVENLRAEQNRASKQISQSSGEERQQLIDETRELTGELKGLEEQLDQTATGLNAELIKIPNIIHPDVPPGFSEDENVVVREVGDRPDIAAPKDHAELGESLGVVDQERAAKVSGSRFAYLLGAGVRLEFALVRFAFDRLEEYGFKPVIPPVLVREEALFGTGFFPTDEAQVYKTAADDLYLVGTSEVPLAAIHTDEVLAKGQLPLRYAGFSTCFRREAGTYGKDMKGIIRLHQFDKVEMFSFTLPEDSEQEHAKLIEIEESILQALEVPYRLVEMCAGDLSSANHRRFDLDAWMPGGNRWLELMSCSNCSDYQARRLNVRTKAESSNILVHTLNGTAVAIQRTVAALFENHQRPDGSISIPEALRPYTGFDSITPMSL